MTTRRKFLKALGTGALAFPVCSLAQAQAKVPRIGFLYFGSRTDFVEVDFSGAFLKGLRDLGYVEGKNIVIEWRFAEGKYERLAGLAAELAQLKVDMIVAASSPGVQAAQRATKTIPIVMVMVGNPVGAGFVASLARPGGNITGLSNVSLDVSIKYLELLHAAVPRLSRVAVLVNPTHPVHPYALKQIQAAAKTIGVNVLPVEASSAEQLDAAFQAMTRERAGALIVVADPLTIMQRHKIAQLAAKGRLPTMAWTRELVEAGGLMSYGQYLPEHYQRAATFVDKILKGAKPADLPVEQSTRLELLINRKTARALGLTIPQSLLISAEKVIE